VRGATIPTACTQLKKHMPVGAKYRVRPIRDEKLMRLASIGSEAFIRGRTDQVRIWIYTDKSTIEEMNKVLFPKATRAVYLEALWQVDQARALNLEDPDMRKCVDPTLIDALNAPKKCKGWFVQTCELADPGALAEAMKKQAPAIREMIKTPAQEVGLAEWIEALAANGSGTVLEGLASFIENAVPPDHAEAILKQCPSLAARDKAVKAGLTARKPALPRSR
jgi:hypothetical protein